MDRHVRTGDRWSRPQGHVEAYGHRSVKILGRNNSAIEANLVDSNGASLPATVEGVWLPGTGLPVRRAARLGAGGARRQAVKRLMNRKKSE